MTTQERYYDYHFFQAVQQGWQGLSVDLRSTLQERKRFLDGAFAFTHDQHHRLAGLEDAIWKSEQRLAPRGPELTAAAGVQQAAGMINDFELDLTLQCYWPNEGDVFYEIKHWPWNVLAIGRPLPEDERAASYPISFPGHTPSRIFRALAAGSLLALQDLLEIDRIWLDFHLRLQITESIIPITAL